MEKKPGSKLRNYLIWTAVAFVLVCGGIFVSCTANSIRQATATQAPVAVVPTTEVPPTATATPTKTTTPTPKPTNTPIPPETMTARAVEYNQTATAAMITATRQASIDQMTEIASYATIDWRELTTYPENHIGEKVRVSGRIFNIVDTIVLQMYVSGTQEPVYVEVLKGFSGLYEDDSIVVYGTIRGKKCFTNQLGGQVCQPHIYAAFYTK